MNDVHKEQEGPILKGFCRDFASQFDTSCEAVAQGESPDATLRVGGKDVLAELARYREQGSRNDAYERDQAFKQFLSDEWSRDDALQHFSIHLTYLMSEKGYKIPSLKPNRKIADDILACLKRLVLFAKEKQTESIVTYFFVPSEKVAEDYGFERVQTHEYLLQEDWLEISQFCSAVRIHHTPAHISLRPSSSLDAFSPKLDLNAIRAVILDKVEKAKQYRTKMSSEQQLWLIVYSEGYHPTGRMHCDQWIPKAREIIKRVIVERPGIFDAIWWADEVEQKRGRIFRMDE